MNKIFIQGLTKVIGVVGLGCLTVSASALTLQPDEANSDDVFAYEFTGNGFDLENPSDLNLDTDSLPAGNVIGALLGSSQSETTDHPVLGDTGHDGVTYIKFDLTGVTLGPSDRAVLSLYVLDGLDLTGAFANPTPEIPVDTQVYAADGSWNEQELTWNNQPGIANLIDTVTQIGVSTWVDFDVTSQVQDWLDGAENNGFVVAQLDVVPNRAGGGLTGVASSLYASSAWEDGTLRPKLEIVSVPESSSTWALLLVGCTGLGVMSRRKKAGSGE